MLKKKKKDKTENLTKKRKVTWDSIECFLKRFNLGRVPLIRESKCPGSKHIYYLAVRGEYRGAYDEIERVKNQKLF